jgi:LmbE family N-acetylglucosaminyl deacetylase
MNYDFREIEKVLVLAPHPDDEALGCSGTIKLLNVRGVSSTVVFITNGEKLYDRPSPAVGEKRKEEGLKASEMLGCRRPLFLNIPDGEVGRNVARVYDGLYGLIAERKPDIIFSPSPIDYHEDHIVTARVVLKLMDVITTFKLSFYEIYSTLRFNYLIDITQVAEEKRRIISTYRSSLYEKPEIYAAGALGLNAQRAIFVQQHGYYEAFYVPGKSDNVATIHDFLLYKDLYAAHD